MSTDVFKDNDGGLSELKNRLENKPKIEAQHVSKSLENKILCNDALLDDQFLTDISANNNHLRDLLAYSAGSQFLTTANDDNMIVDGDKTYPKWPNNKNNNNNSNATDRTNNIASFTTDSHEMAAHLRNLNVTVAALGLGLAISNDEGKYKAKGERVLHSRIWKSNCSFDICIILLLYFNLVLFSKSPFSSFYSKNTPNEFIFLTITIFVLF